MSKEDLKKTTDQEEQKDTTEEVDSVQESSEQDSGTQGGQQEFSVNKKGFIEAEGEIEELLPGLKFRVVLDNGHEITATMAGRMRMNRIQLVFGDRVKVEMSPYDMTKGRITYRK